ncbi:hypothetical protein OG21DRAFT_1507394 [Imleria badia]|nr:hypothetical protein OG21DRAFT_1507394 [Imleria badia]
MVDPSLGNTQSPGPQPIQVLYRAPTMVPSQMATRITLIWETPRDRFAVPTECLILISLPANGTDGQPRRDSTMSGESASLPAGALRIEIERATGDSFPVFVSVDRSSPQRLQHTSNFSDGLVRGYPPSITLPSSLGSIIRLNISEWPWLRTL